jgi:antiviral helicase SKI2
MCGRAGRRGIDSIGHIFILIGDKKYPPKKDDIVGMMKGGGDEVESKFRLSYKTIIQFLSRNNKDIMTFFKESFLENNLIMMRPDILNKINHLKEEISKMEKISCFYIDDDRFIIDYIENQNKILDIRRNIFIVSYI